MDELQRILRSLNGGRILDVATSHGDFLRLLTDCFDGYTEAVGIDTSAERISTARQRSGNKLSFRIMDAEDIRFPDNYFDTVAMRHSLHHLRRPEAVLGEMHRVLKPGGLFLIGEIIRDPESVQPNSYQHIHHWWARVDRTQGVSHNDTFTREQIEGLIDRLQLSEVAWLELDENVEESEVPQVLEDTIRHTNDQIDVLRRLGGHDDLIAAGRELLARYRTEGFCFEKVLYLLGEKPSA